MSRTNIHIVYKKIPNLNNYGNALIYMRSRPLKRIENSLFPRIASYYFEQLRHFGVVFLRKRCYKLPL